MDVFGKFILTCCCEIVLRRLSIISFRVASFCFTKLDPSDPSREFSFLLIVDEDDKFDVVECQPTIEATQLIEIVAELNRTEDMSVLARRMRKCFMLFVTFFTVPKLSH
jgi:hypothetical protein